MTRASKRTLSPTHQRGGWRAAVSVLAIGSALGISACTSADNGTQAGDQETAAASPQESAGQSFATADLADVDGNPVGEMTFAEADGSVQLAVSTEGMAPGFYGLHLHEVGKCEAESAAPEKPTEIGAFKSAGGHLPGQEDAKHPNHAGDLPTLLVREDGTASMTVHTDRFNKSLLFDDDGTAVMIHSKPDNFANIPERYAADGPDQETTAAGDAGDRLACGVVQN